MLSHRESFRFTLYSLFGPLHRMDVMEKTRQHVERTASLGAEEEQGDMMDERELEIYRCVASKSSLFPSLPRNGHALDLWHSPLCSKASLTRTYIFIRTYCRKRKHNYSSNGDMCGAYVNHLFVPSLSVMVLCGCADGRSDA